MNETERTFITRRVNATLLRYAAILGIANVGVAASFMVVVWQKTQEQVQDAVKKVAVEYANQQLEEFVAITKNANERLENIHKFSDQLYIDAGSAQMASKYLQANLKDVTSQAEKMRERLERVSRLDEAKIDWVLKKLNEGDSASLLKSFAENAENLEKLKEQIDQDRVRSATLASDHAGKIEKAVQLVGKLEKEMAYGEPQPAVPINGWKSSKLNPPPAYRKAGDGVVYLEGCAVGDGIGTGDGTPPPMLMLPAGFRPTQKSIFAVAASHKEVGYVWVDPNGLVTFSHITKEWVSLDGISFLAAN